VPIVKGRETGSGSCSVGSFFVTDDETSAFIAGQFLVPWQSDRPSRVPRAYDIENFYTSAGKPWTRAVELSCSRIRRSSCSSSSSSNSSSLYANVLIHES
jgi:hypothetical protein